MNYSEYASGTSYELTYLGCIWNFDLERLNRDENLVNLRRLYCAKLLKIMLGGLHDNIQYHSCTRRAFPLGPTKITVSFHGVGLPDSNCFLSSHPALRCTEPQKTVSINVIVVL